MGRESFKGEGIALGISRVGIRVHGPPVSHLCSKLLSKVTKSKSRLSDSIRRTFFLQAWQFNLNRKENRDERLQTTFQTIFFEGKIPFVKITRFAISRTMVFANLPLWRQSSFSYVAVRLTRFPFRLWSKPGVSTSGQVTWLPLFSNWTGLELTSYPRYARRVEPTYGYPASSRIIFPSLPRAARRVPR